MNHPLLASEPEFGPWVVVAVEVVVESLTASIPQANQCGIIAVDGRSGSGKTTAATQIKDALENAAVVHTDDIAWHHSFFGWSHLMIDGVLTPARRGESVDFRPPAWIERDRPGSIEVDPGNQWLLVEGVGAARNELMPYLDGVVWVHSDFARARARGIERDGGDPEAEAFWDEWMDEELPFLDEHRPWERADLVINGTPDAGRQSGMEIATGFVT